MCSYQSPMNRCFLRLEVAKALGVLPPRGPMPTKTHPVETPQATTVSSLLTLDEAMKQHIEAALTLTRGRIEGPFGAARILRINPHTLRARMRKLGMEWKKYKT